MNGVLSYSAYLQLILLIITDAQCRHYLGRVDKNCGDHSAAPEILGTTITDPRPVSVMNSLQFIPLPPQGRPPAIGATCAAKASDVRTLAQRTNGRRSGGRSFRMNSMTLAWLPRARRDFASITVSGMSVVALDDARGGSAVRHGSGRPHDR
jgi:hypothetical protein